MDLHIIEKWVKISLLLEILRPQDGVQIPGRSSGQKFPECSYVNLKLPLKEGGGGSKLYPSCVFGGEIMWHARKHNLLAHWHTPGSGTEGKGCSLKKGHEGLSGIFQFR